MTVCGWKSCRLANAPLDSVGRHWTEEVARTRIKKAKIERETGNIGRKKAAVRQELEDEDKERRRPVLSGHVTSRNGGRWK